MSHKDEFPCKQRSTTKEYRDGYDQIDWSKKSSSQEPTTEPTPPEPEEGLPEETQASEEDV